MYVCVYIYIYTHMYISIDILRASGGLHRLAGAPEDSPEGAGGPPA